MPWIKLPPDTILNNPAAHLGKLHRWRGCEGILTWQDEEAHIFALEKQSSGRFIRGNFRGGNDWEMWVGDEKAEKPKRRSRAMPENSEATKEAIKLLQELSREPAA